MSSTADFLIQLAVEKGRLQAREVEAARAAAGRALTPGELAATLIASGQISERELAQLAADAARLPFRTGDELRPEAAANGCCRANWPSDTSYCRCHYARGC